MDRETAVKVLKQILCACSGITPFMAIMPPNADSELSKGYQLHIKTRPATLDRNCIENISVRNNLALKEDEGVLVIYKPQK